MHYRYIHINIYIIYIIIYITSLPEGCAATNIATWNVRTLNDARDFKLQNLLNEMKRLKLEILGVA